MTKVTAPEIRSGEGLDVGLDDHFFISRESNVGQREYLHPDGQWRTSTASKDGVTGWYNSEAAAQAVIDKYC